MTTRLPLPVSRPLAARLDREWLAIRERPAVLRRVAGWGLGIPFRSLDDVVAATGYWASRAERLAAADRGDAGSSDGNDVLCRLLLAARTDDLAARVVLQRLLPGVAARARRWGERRAGGSADAFDELVSAIWMVIREFPVERRPRHLAANLLRDGEYLAFARSNRRMLVLEPTDPSLLDLPVHATPVPDGAEELAEVVACARSLTEHDLRLLELLAEGRSPHEVASALQISVRTMRNHRDAVVHRLRVAALAA